LRKIIKLWILSNLQKSKKRHLKLKIVKMNKRKQSLKIWLSKFKLYRMFKDKNVNYINMDKINKYEEDFAKI